LQSVLFPRIEVYYEGMGESIRLLGYQVIRKQVIRKIEEHNHILVLVTRPSAKALKIETLSLAGEDTSKIRVFPY